MYNFTRSFSVRLAIVVLGLLIILPQALAALSDTSSTETDVTNVSPVIRETVSDGGSNSSAPTNVGSNVTFTTKAADVNSNDYYLAVCKYQYVKAGNDAAPSCCTDAGLLTCTAAEKWAISTATAIAATASVTYTAQSGDPQSNAWYAFVCDKVATTAACYPAGGAGDTGFALGTVTFTGVPVDGATLTIDSITYEFDTAGNGVSGGTEVDTSASQVAAHAAAALVAVEAGTSSHMVSRSNVVYVYADSAGAGGNSLGMAESGDTGNLIALSGSVLAGGSDANASPFKVNHAGTFGTVTVTDDSDGTIAPGDTLKFKLSNAQIDDTDTDGSQDTLTMHICTTATTAFDYVGNTCTGGATICDSSAVDPTAADATCTGGASLVSVPTAHGSYNFKVYVEDSHDLAATGTATQSYSVIDVPPVSTGYTATDTPNLSAGDSDTIDFSASLKDDNGDNDVTNIKGVFFDKVATTHACSASENNCYIQATCTPTGVSTPGTGKTATGTDENLGANCQVTIWFNANAANWDVEVQATDGTGVTSFADANVSLANAALTGINVVQASIAYGSVAVGNVSAKQATAMENMGNQALDIMLDGDNMACGSSSCTGQNIGFANQKWYHTDTDFNWSATSTAPGPYALVDTASGTGDATGCLNRDIAVRTIHDNTSTNESIYWKLRIPDEQALGSYSGVNSFTTTAGTTCTTGQSY